jgi:hypothetical protein
MARNFGSAGGSLRRAIASQAGLRNYPHLPLPQLDYDADSVGSYGAPSFSLTDQSVAPGSGGGFSWGQGTGVTGSSDPTMGIGSTYTNPYASSYQASTNAYDVQAASRGSAWQAGGQVAATGVGALITGLFNRKKAQQPAAGPAYYPPQSSGMSGGAVAALVVGGVLVLGLGAALVLK